ncbi:Hypothetical protein, putative [Bodo saltans]|uniref:Uncharacterized protein n=1 Tax=Bodo saltans TaxID=75058 RepID=A0A0S4J132_BODSA|nr:Hypothetical protein, putative [Bodo saltans]|eukprot:CUG79314.1 Hypothetical protein, putative [Bodo saltans]
MEMVCSMQAKCGEKKKQKKQKKKKGDQRKTIRLSCSSFLTITSISNDDAADEFSMLPFR